MIKTLKTSNGMPAFVGNVQTQPVNTIVATVKARTTPLTPSLPPASQVSVRVALLNAPAPGGVLTLQKAVSSLVSQPRLRVVIPHSTNATRVVPSYNLPLQPISLFDANSVAHFTTATRKFQPYELLTGISQDSPMIVMLTEFLPLFVHDIVSSDHPSSTALEGAGVYPYMTDAGRFLDLQVNSTNVQFDDIAYIIKALRDRYPNIDADIKQRTATFKAAAAALSNSSNFLLTVNRGLAHLKHQLDLRDDINVVKTNDIITFYVLNFEKNNTLTTQHPLFDIASRYTPPSYTFIDLMSRLGYDALTVRNVFSSTKIWLQFASELKINLQKQSLEFLGLTSQRIANDKNAAVLTHPLATEPGNVRRFDTNVNAPNVPLLADLTAIKTDHFKSTIDLVSDTYDKLYVGADSIRSGEMYIAAIVNMLSKELRYSIGLGRQTVQETLRSYYGYSVVDTSNVGVWDAVIGLIGNNITDVPKTQTNSLTSLAYRSPAPNVSVATFESKYIDGDTGTLTSGGDFYAGDVIAQDNASFDTSNMDDLAAFMNTAGVQFGSIVNGLNVLAYHDPNDKEVSAIMSNPVDMIKRFLDRLIDNKTLQQLSDFSNDNLVPMYVAAASHNNIKSLLFVHAVARMTRTYKTDAQTSSTDDNTALTAYIETTILTALDKVVPATSAAAKQLNTTLSKRQLKALGVVGNSVSLSVPSITKQAIKLSLSEGTSLSNIIEAFMNDVLTSFHDTQALVGNRTRYGSYIDTVIMMITFDIAVRTIAAFANSTFTGASPSNSVSSASANTQGYIVSRTVVDHASVYTSLFARLEREQALTQMMVYSIINTLKSVAGTASGYSVYLRSPSTVAGIKDVATIVDDPTLLKLLLEPQQAMLISSAADDVFGTLLSSLAVAAKRTDILAFDGLAVPKTLRDIIYGFFGTAQHASVLGYNKKVMTVGIPVGFSQHIKQRVNINTLQRTSFTNKKDDIVSVVVYRSDMNNSDIIYRPIKFLFELSRFPVRNTEFLHQPPQQPTLNDIMKSVPTRVYNSKTFAPHVEYWQATASSQSALTTDDYSFLTADQKFEIAHNHVASYLAEAYIRLLTGVSAAEDRFDIIEHPRPVDSPFVKTLVEHSAAMINEIASRNNVSVVQKQVPAGSVLFSTTSQKSTPSDGLAALTSTSGVAGTTTHPSKMAGISAASSPQKSTDQQQATATLDSSLSALSAAAVPAMVTVLQTVSNLSLMTTQLSDPAASSTRLLRPKQFDRVFNIIIDPDDFEIDVSATVATPHGKLALQQLITSGDVVSVPSMNNTPTHTNRYVFRQHDKNQGDMTLDKYFVAVETFDEVKS